MSHHGLVTRRRVGVAAVLAVLLVLALWASTQSQPTTASLDSEIARINGTNLGRATDRPVGLGTGSASVRLWPNPELVVPGTQLVNTGLMGSAMADLSMHLQELVVRFQPGRW